jgi:hypothetical protein
MAATQPATARRRYQARPGRSTLVAPRLELLSGPSSGQVELPVWLFWSGRDRGFDLGDADQRAWLYETVLREAGHPDDLMAFLNGDVLVRIWPEIRMRLPKGVRLAWEDRHPQLGASAKAGTGREGSAAASGSATSAA